MDYNEVINLIKVIEESNINTFEIDFEDTYISLSKLSNNDNKHALVEETSTEIIDMKAPEVITKEVVGQKTESNVETGNIVKSPIVGTFYDSSSPDKPAFVKVGDTVHEGDTLCIVEAMKVMNEVKSKYDGVITKILLKNEDSVEYNQPLFVIE